MRLTERFLASDPPTTEELEAAAAHVRALLPALAVERAIGVAGTVTTVAAIDLGLDRVRPHPDPRPPDLARRRRPGARRPLRAAARRARARAGPRAGPCTRDRRRPRRPARGDGPLRPRPRSRRASATSCTESRSPQRKPGRPAEGGHLQPVSRVSRSHPVFAPNVVVGAGRPRPHHVLGWAQGARKYTQLSWARATWPGVNSV